MSFFSWPIKFLGMGLSLLIYGVLSILLIIGGVCLWGYFSSAKESDTGKAILSVAQKIRSSENQNEISPAVEEVSSSVTSETMVPQEGLTPIHRLLFFALAILLLPIFSISFLIKMTEKKSNWVNGFLLLTYTLVNFIIGFLLFYPVNSFWSVILAVLIVAGLFYDVQIMTVAHRKNSRF